MADRIARFQFDKSAKKVATTLTVAAPSKVTPKEFEFIQKSIFDRIGGLTGCRACLSGFVRVIIEEDFRDVIQVDLQTGAQL